MPAPDDVTATLRHWAPVRLRHRAGMPERIAFDPMLTPVRIRGVDPDAFEIRDLPVELHEGKMPSFARAYVMEGKLWKRIRRIDEYGARSPANLDQALAILSGAVDPKGSPFRPALPDSHRLNAYPGDVPIPSRAMARASRAYHDLAEARIRAVAEDGIVHDGRSVLVAMDHPLLFYGMKARADLGWRRREDLWSPMFRYDRPGDVALMRSTMGVGRGDDDHRIKQLVSAGLVEAMRGVAPRDDDLRRFFIGGAFAVADCLAGYEEAERPPGAEQALADLCARASIDAIGEDYNPIALLFRSVTKDASSRIRTAEHTTLRKSAFIMDRYLTQVVQPRLAGGPLPSEDADALGALAP